MHRSYNNQEDSVTAAGHRTTEFKQI